MTTEEINQLSDRLWSAINTKEAEGLSREEQIAILRSLLIIKFKDVYDTVRRNTINECTNQLKNIK